MNVALFGFMGVGKSTVGRVLAERSGLRFVDLDAEIEARAGKGIPSIFEEQGEAAFREIEKIVALEAAASDRQVIACGGGTVLDAESREGLSETSIMILLTAEPDTILERVEVEDETRPLLQVDERIGRIEDLLAARNPHYIKAADIIIDTTGMTPQMVADHIMRLIGGEL
ncbi:MAG: shikimate kinase [Candidatus Bathyarchaeota archaeon]|nr:MAG: shikimate kinase [Candidatus Bathyarchaeota archaeon]